MPKPILMIVTRLTDRPHYKEFESNLLKRNWKDSKADLMVIIHSKSNGPHKWKYELDLVNTAHSIGNCVGCIDLGSKAGGNIPNLVHHIIEPKEDFAEYEYIGVMDDDAEYTDPVKAMDEVLTAFTLCKKIGMVGPMGGLRKMWRYEGHPEFLQLLHRNPWTTLGSQIYRREAVWSIPIDYLLDLKFRADSIISMMLYAHGWEVYEMDLPFKHIVAGGLSTNKHTIETHEQRIIDTEHDHAIYIDTIKKYCNSPDFLLGEASKLRWASINHHTKKISKLRTQEKLIANLPRL